MSITHNQNIYVLFARDVSTDASDGMNTITKVIEKFTFTVPEEDYHLHTQNTDSEPKLYPVEYMIATAWYLERKLKEDTDFTVELELVSESGKNLGGPNQTFTVPQGKDRITVNMGVNGIPVDISGTYRMNAALVLQGKRIAEGSYPIEVLVAKA